jgi:hypothetical protein
VGIGIGIPMDNFGHVALVHWSTQYWGPQVYHRPRDAITRRFYRGMFIAVKVPDVGDILRRVLYQPT